MTALRRSFAGLDRALTAIGVTNFPLVALVLPAEGRKLVAALRAEGLKLTRKKTTHGMWSVRIGRCEVVWPRR